MKKIIFIFLLLIFAVTGHEKRSIESDRCAVTSDYIVSNQIFDNNSLYLNFEVYPKFSKEVYEDPMWSVKIVDYRSDGVSKKPQYYPVIFFSHINGRKVRAQDGKLLLETGLWEFYTGEYVGGDDLFQKIQLYEPIYGEVREIDIKFVFTYTDGSYDPGCYLLKLKRKD